MPHIVPFSVAGAEHIENSEVRLFNCPVVGMLDGICRSTLLWALAAIGACAQQPAAFDAASIKPSAIQATGRGSGGPGLVRFMRGSVSCRGVTARRIVLEAYHLTEAQVSGGPSWLDSERYDLEAKSEGPANGDELRKMLQTLLAERFKLEVNHLTKDIAVYALTVAKRGSKLVQWKEAEPLPKTTRRADAKILGTIEDRGTLQHFADVLSNQPAIDRPVLDKTGLTGIYVFALVQYSDEDLAASLESQMGLRLESSRAPLPAMVITHIERPSAN